MTTPQNLRTIAMGVLCCTVTMAVAPTAESNSPGALSEIDGVESLLTREPAALAEKVIRSGQVRFLGIAGFAVSAPGIDNDQCVAEPSRIFVVPKTSDVLTDRQMVLQGRAEAFATQYNTTRLSETISSRGAFLTHISCACQELAHDRGGPTRLDNSGVFISAVPASGGLSTAARAWRMWTSNPAP